MPDHLSILPAARPAPQAPAEIRSTAQSDPLRQAAQELEASFLAEMLKSAGLGKSRESFGGGTGEDQFSTFMIRAQATEMAKAGGIGLAESLYHALKERQND
jgi:Rod binding domain-containing protein